MQFALPILGLTINIWIVILGLFIGGLSAMFGVGGGVMLVPILTLVFNVPPASAAGSSLAQMIPTGLFGLVPHWRKGNVVWQVTAALFIGAALGIEVGAYLQNSLKVSNATFEILGAQVMRSEVYLMLGLTVVYLLQGAFLVYEAQFIPKRENGEPTLRFPRILRAIDVPPRLDSPQGFFEPFPLPTFIFIGLIAGVAIAYLGLGGGFVAVPVFIYLVGLDTRKAVGSSLLLVFMAAIWSTVRHGTGGRENVDWSIAVSIMIGSLVGTQLGAKLNSIVKPQNIRRWFGYIILSTAVLVWVGFILKCLLKR